MLMTQNIADFKTGCLYILQHFDVPSFMVTLNVNIQINLISACKVANNRKHVEIYRNFSCYYYFIKGMSILFLQLKIDLSIV